VDNDGGTCTDGFNHFSWKNTMIIHYTLSIIHYQFIHRNIRATSKKYFTSRQRGILPQIKIGRPQEYFVYFKGFQTQSWGKRTGVLPKNIFGWRPKRKKAAAFTAAALNKLYGDS